MTGAELARVTCAEQGVPFTVDDDQALDAIAALIAATHREGGERRAPAA